jgi:transcriptional regulator with XRE-family HTH domain
VGESFADRLQRLRHAAGLSQNQLATAADLPVVSLRNWERARRLPGLDAAAKIARALGVSLDVLAGEPEKMMGEAEPKTAGRPRKTPAAVAADPTSKTRKGKK